MFSFYVDPDFDMLFENLTAQIGARLGLGSQFQFDGTGILWVNIVK